MTSSSRPRPLATASGHPYVLIAARRQLTPTSCGRRRSRCGSRTHAHLAGSFVGGSRGRRLTSHSASSFERTPSPSSRRTEPAHLWALRAHLDPGPRLPRARRRCGLSRLARGRDRARGLRALDRAVSGWPGGVGLGGSRAAGRPRCSASLAGALEGGRPVRSPRGCRGAHGGRASGGGEPRSRDGSPSSRPASGEAASMSVCRPRSTRRRSRPASTC